MADTLVSIAIPCPLRRHFDYLWPGTLGCAPQPGLRVRLPFGRRELVGVVLGESEGSQVDTAKLRAVSEVLDDSPSLSAELLALVVIPELRISDVGLVDVTTFEKVDLFV